VMASVKAMVLPVARALDSLAEEFGLRADQVGQLLAWFMEKPMAGTKARTWAFWACILVLSVPGTVWGQQEQTQLPGYTGSQIAPDVSQGPPPDQPALQQRNPRYRIQPADGLTISFPLSPEFDQPSGCTTTVACSVMVQPDGYISVKGAGSLYVQGMSVPEVEEALTKAYSGILHNPIIHVDLVDFQKPFFLVSGQVGKPGEYDLRHDTTVSEAIAMAGGFAPTAKTQVFLFHRVSTGWVEVKKLDLKDILHGKNANEDAQLSPGDMIFVPEKFITNFRKYVPYAISGTAGTYIVPN
jgi:polysaccharide export outer membrane protein